MEDEWTTDDFVDEDYLDEMASLQADLSACRAHLREVKDRYNSLRAAYRDREALLRQIVDRCVKLGGRVDDLVNSSSG